MTTRNSPPDGAQVFSRRRVWSNLCRAGFVLALLDVLAQVASLVARAALGSSDFSVIYRTAALLNAGAGAWLYTQPDAQNGWQRCISPAGLLWFEPLALVHPRLAATIWSMFNLALLGASVAALRQVVGRLERRRRIYQSVFGWMVVILLLLATGSLQVGQFSVLFAACWIFALYAASRESRFAMGLALAIPSVVKLYPALMLAVPLFTRRRREVLWFGASLLLVGVVLPLLILGSRTAPLTLSFLQNVIFNTQGRIAESQHLGRHPDQGLDAVLLRYLSYSPQFHDFHRGLPHLGLEHARVLRIANAIRVVVLLFSGAVALRRQRATQWNGWSQSSLHAALEMAALWSATLYLLLPGTKSRYAVYTFLAFLPLLAAASASRLNARRLAAAAWCALIAGCLTLILLLIPEILRAYGAGFLGAVALWTANIGLLNRASRHRVERAELPSRPISNAANAQEAFPQ